VTDWKVSGEYFEVCNCEAICPCIVFSPPTSGECIAVIGWKIREGHHGDTDLSGLNVGLVANAQGNMKDGNWRVALYTDARANDAQAEALAAIFSGQAGGHLENLGPLIGEVLGAKPAAIELQHEGKRFSMRIGDNMSGDYELIEGQEGGDVQVTGHPLAPAPGVPFTVGRSNAFKFNDYGLEVDVAGKNAFSADFVYHP
jgi:hypothetical protein